MGSSSSKSPGVKRVSLLSKDQREIEEYLSPYILDKLQTSVNSKDLISDLLAGTTRQYIEDVSTPLQRTFQTEVQPKIEASFRRGGLFSKASGDAVTRGYGNLMDTISTQAAEKDWQTTQLRAQLFERSVYDPTAIEKFALGYMGTPTMENIAYPRQSGNFFNTPMGGAMMGIGTLGLTGGLGSMLTGGGFWSGVGQSYNSFAGIGESK
jgi:hypothetical protein